MPPFEFQPYVTFQTVCAALALMEADSEPQQAKISSANEAPSSYHVHNFTQKGNGYRNSRDRNLGSAKWLLDHVTDMDSAGK
jgi:hypothetical protein